MAKIKIYTTDYCPYCKKAKAILNQKGVAYDEIDITDNEGEMRNKLAEMTGGKATVPQIFLDGKSIGGCSDLEVLISSGEFDKMVKQE